MTDQSETTEKPKLQPIQDQTIAMLTGYGIMLFSSDWHWGLVGAILTLGGLAGALWREKWKGNDYDYL